MAPKYAAIMDIVQQFSRKEQAFTPLIISY